MRLFFLLLLFSLIIFFVSGENVPTTGFNPILRPKAQDVINAGSSYTILWETSAVYATGFVTICLIGGKNQATQQMLANITDAVPSSAGRYVWPVPSSLGTKPVYGLVLRWNQDPSIFQYSNPFHIISSPKSTITTTNTNTVRSETPSNTALAVVMTTPAAVHAHHTAAAPSTLPLSLLHLLLLTVLVDIIFLC